MLKQFAAICFFLFSTSSFGNNLIFSGAWIEDITPNIDDGQVCLGGYGTPFSRCHFEGALDPITVRSIAMSDFDTTAIFISVDTTGLGDELTDNIRSNIQNFSFGLIRKENVFVSATHSHAGPDLQGLWGGSSSTYKDKVIHKATKAGLLSYFLSRPAQLSAVSSKANAFNRRGWGYTDDTVNTLIISSLGSNKTIATIINGNAHPTILDENNHKFSSDYIHPLRATVEQHMGGVAMYINGIIGDSVYQTNVRTYERAQEIGTDVAQGIIDNLGEATRVTGDFDHNTTSTSLRVENPAVLQAEAIGLLDIDLNLANVSFDTTSFRFGDGAIGMSAPGEVTTRLGLPLKNSTSAENTFFFGLMNASYGYFLPSDEFLTIPGRVTEESASLSRTAGDTLKALIESNQ